MGERLNVLICDKFGKRTAYIIRVSAQTLRKERRVFNIIKQNIYNANIFDIYKFRKISTRPCGISLSVPFCAFCAFLRFLCLSTLSVPFCAFCAFLRLSTLSVPFCAFCAFLRFLCPSALSVPFCAFLCFLCLSAPFYQSAFVSVPLPSRCVTVMLGTNIGCSKSNVSNHILFRLSV